MRKGKRTPPTYVATAGWSLPRAVQSAFPAAGSHLERYASRFAAVEINSTFYRPHRTSTFERWAASVPDAFRFSLKLPKAITHEARLVDPSALLDAFLRSVAPLGGKLAALLVQLPPSLAFDRRVARAFLELLRQRFDRAVVLEARHASWFTPDVSELLAGHRVARVAADPSPVPEAATPGGWSGVAYFRLHGSPRMYYSSYDANYIETLAERLRTCSAAGAETWCVFDNTASGAAMENALAVQRILGGGGV